MSETKKIMAKLDAETMKLIGEQSDAFVSLVKTLFDDPRLDNLAEVYEMDRQFLAAQITCLAVSLTLESYPGTLNEIEVLKRAVNRKI